ncbi:MAG: XisI protein [Desulfobacterales bacterium]|nr:XisI protein [Desulfobacterales bacterium]
MEKIQTYRNYIKQLIQQFGIYLPISENVETQYIFDTEHDHYQLFQVGWEKYNWIHGCILHIDIKNGKIWIQHNGTETGIADELVALGVPKNDIVLGFQAPYKRRYTGFAEE